MALNSKLIKRFEATTVYSHPKATADIVLVHGLNGSPDNTWTAKNGLFWPIQLLVPTLANAPANIIVYGYNADVTTWKKDSTPTDNFVYHHAQNLVMSLATHRQNAKTTRNPIIWVCHSLGGIVVKRALLYSNDVRDLELDHCRSIYVSTYAMIFLGTPHTGSNLASWGRVLQGMAGILPRKLLDSEPVLLKTLKKDNVVLQDINLHFLDIYRRFKIHMVRENKKTDLKWTVDFVVDVNSAGPQLPGVTYYSIEATHSTMCKFENDGAPGYSNVSSAIRQWVLEAPESIRTRWRVEEEERAARALNEVREITKGVPATLHHTSHSGAPPSYASDVLPTRRGMDSSWDESLRSVSSMPPLEEPEPKKLQPLVIHPYRIRPNAHFKGRQLELVDLHRILRDQRRREIGTSAVLVQSLPGGGKSHLARQYIYLHGLEYHGGIYWIPSRSEQEMEEAFWKIARAKALQEFDAEPWKRDLLDPKTMVEAVRSWFESIDDWLIVFDGIHFDTPREATFIPNAKNTSILYTSTNRAGHGNHKFDNPVLLELGRLSQQEAQELLLEEMGKGASFSASDLAQAGQAVDLMGRLPVMIHMAGQHLKTTREPLVKYIHSFRDRRKVGTLDAFRSVREELERRGEIEALNLMYILSFFAQNIPVEMLVLGLHALDIRTPIKARDATNRRSLNSTLTVLIKWALIGRNESDDGSSVSSSSTPPSVGCLPDSLDTLRIHSIIQEFFVDTTIECKEVAFWLDRAVSLFCHSYDSADARMRMDWKVGLPDDYRRYSIHGKQLLSRLEQLMKKHPQVSSLRFMLQERLDSIRLGIKDLTETLAGTIIQGRSDQVPMSIFEAANSISDSDSAKTSQEATSQEETFSHHEYGKTVSTPQGYLGIVESPTIYQQPGPYETRQAPYPEDGGLPIPRYPEGAITDGGTITPRIRLSPEELWDLPPSPSNHRTVKKREGRRYHDSTGSMRLTRDGYADARLTVSQKCATGSITSPGIRSGSPLTQSPDNARSKLLKISNSSSWRKKSAPSSRATSPFWSLLGKPFRTSSLTSESGSVPRGVGIEVTGTKPLVSIVSEDGTLLGTDDDGVYTLATGPPSITRFSSNSSDGLQDRLLMSGVNSGTSSMWNAMPISIPPSRQQGASHIDNEDLASFPPADVFSVDSRAWRGSLQPTGYTSQPMSRQTSDVPAARAQGGAATPRSLPSGYATPVARRRRPSHIETEPSPRQAFLEYGSPPRQSRGEILQDGGDDRARRATSCATSRTGRTMGPPDLVTAGLGRGAGRGQGTAEESLLSGGFLTGDGGFVAFGEGDARGGEEDLRGVGLGILGGHGSF